jgi:hypothetical protein
LSSSAWADLNRRAIGHRERGDYQTQNPGDRQDGDPLRRASFCDGAAEFVTAGAAMAAPGLRTERILRKIVSAQG